MHLQEFPVSVIEKLGYYVYLLLDPETHQVFYIGKGTGNRVFAHVNAAIAHPTPGEKMERIKAINQRGLAVGHMILRHGLTEKEAFEVEATMIDYVGIGTLTNQVAGLNSDERGLMDVADIIVKYAAPEINITEPVILITVNRLYRKGMNDAELYEVTRGDWVIGVRREKARYALTVYNGIVRAVYTITAWRAVIYSDTSYKTLNRWRFDGTIAHELEHYVGGSTLRYAVANAQNPIRYINC